VSPNARFTADSEDPLSPVDGGWNGAHLSRRTEQWRIPFPSEVADELVTFARSPAAHGLRRDIFARRPDGLTRTGAFAERISGELSAHLGFVVLTDFPVDALSEPAVETAYWTFGLFLGRPVSQNSRGELLGRVEDRGADIGSPVQRGYESSAALPFHVDRTDVVGLLCVRPAAAGGISRLVSAKTVHDVLLTEAPGLLAELYRPFPGDRRGEQQPGEPGWTCTPIFSRIGPSFAMRYVRRFIEASQRHPGVPVLTDRQRSAMDALDAVLERPGIALEIELRRGDLQLINNFHILHARTAFTDDSASGRRRLLLRLWLAFAGSPQLPAHYVPLYGSTRAASYRGGVWPADGVPDVIGADLSALGSRSGPAPAGSAGRARGTGAR
jgi:hypothetical protein